MSMTVDDVLALSRSVAAEFGDAVDVAGVASNQVDAGRIELLLTIVGRQEPTRVLLNLERGDRETFQSTLRGKLQDALAAQSV
jgi:hypothetical protein